MEKSSIHIPYLLRPASFLLIVGLVIVNVTALFSFNPYYIGSFFSFLYLIIAPGFLLLSLLVRKKFPPMLGVAFSVALSVFILMVVGLFLNTALPRFGIFDPLQMQYLIIAFDVVLYLLLFCDFIKNSESPFEFHSFNTRSWIITVLATLCPILSVAGAISLNNNGSNVFTMLALFFAGLTFGLTVYWRDKLSPTIAPLSLFLIALSFLLMNSLRGWYITGHDILLEYHVFELTRMNEIWKMSHYQDAYNACLSLTILPTFIQKLIHVEPAYIFKFFTQFLGALPAIVIYYLVKSYSSEKLAYLAGFLYISFPTFMVDMAFLNRQGIAFLFFSALIFTLFHPEYFNKHIRILVLLLLGTGMVISHYSTSYIAVPVLLCSYIINRLLRWVVRSKRPKFFVTIMDKLGNKDMYEKPILLTLPFVLGLLCIMFVWSTTITKTSNNLAHAIDQIILTIKNPFSLDSYSGPAKYSLVQSKESQTTELFDTFFENGIYETKLFKDQSEFFPKDITDAYSTYPVPEYLKPVTSFGSKLENIFNINLIEIYPSIKQLYAKLVQLFLIIGLTGLMVGYGFKKYLSQQVPVEYLAVSISGILVMVAQTVLPASAINYGLLRLFQQNLTYLLLPIILGLFIIVSFISKRSKIHTTFVTAFLLFFFVMLSGLFPQFTGGSRPLLSLNNNGLYYDSYYTHAQEVSAMNWTTRYANPTIPIQAAHFSDIKMVAYGRIQPRIDLLPQTTRKNSYVYLNYTNVDTNHVIEIVNGDVLYYYFPVEFLVDNKNLVYNNGGSELYR